VEGSNPPRTVDLSAAQTTFLLHTKGPYTFFKIKFVLATVVALAAGVNAGVVGFKSSKGFFKPIPDPGGFQE
jgi:hypothetical protein